MTEPRGEPPDGREKLASQLKVVWAFVRSKELLAWIVLLWALAFPIRTPRFGDLSLDGLRHPVLLLELLAGGLYAQPVTAAEAFNFPPSRNDLGVETLLAEAPFAIAPPPANNLPWQALVLPAIAPEQSAGRFIYLGVLGPLMLLVVAWVLGWRELMILGVLFGGSWLLLDGLGFPFHERAETRHVEWLLSVLLANASIAGLLVLFGRLRKPLPAGFLMVIGSLSVVIAALCIGCSVKAGALTDRALLAPFLERVAAASPAHDAGAAAEWPPWLIARNAAHLRAVLDHAALAAFASMTALLLHLKSRNALTFWLVAIVWAADVVSAFWLG